MSAVRSEAAADAVAITAAVLAGAVIIVAIHPDTSVQTVFIDPVAAWAGPTWSDFVEWLSSLVPSGPDISVEVDL